MNPELLVSRLLLFLPFLVLAVLNGALIRVVIHGLRIMVEDKSGGGPPGWMWQSLLFVSIMDLVFFAALDVGQSLVLLTDGGAGVFMLTQPFFVAWLGFKAVGKWADKKGTTIDATVGKDGGTP